MWDDATEVGRYVGSVDPTPAAFRPEGESVLARAWTTVLAHGLLWLAFGGLVLAWPDPSLKELVALIAAGALGHGAISGVAAFTVPLGRGERVWVVSAALVDVVIGAVLLLGWSELSATAVLYVFAAWVLALGVLQAIAVRVLPLSGERATVLSWSGIVPIVFGVVMLVEASDGALASTALIAAFALVTGVLQTAFALDLRRLSRGSSD
jgi:uncharacterized membrane protein HdeD (DUF308 family)